jgi:hypothetical protein
VHLTTILEFILSYYILIMILGCALDYRSWLDTLVALQQLSDLWLGIDVGYGRWLSGQKTM